MPINNADFDGNIGICLSNMTFSNDSLLLIVLVLLSIFALVFRFNVPLFGKMISNITANEQRQSIFNTTEKDNFLFSAFMTFQTLLLCSILLFTIGTKYQYFIKPNVVTTLIYVGGLFVVLFLFYLFKRFIHNMFGYIFTENNSQKILSINYQSLLCSWGVSLYIPVLWILLIGKYFFVSYIVFAISYLAFRVVLNYRLIYIFFNKKTGLLFLSLYLCAQEIISLIFLYEGLIYIYNIIKTNTVWQ